MLPDASISDDELTEIYAQSRGNPLFVRELADDLRLRAGLVVAHEGCQGPSSLAGRSQVRGRVLTALRLALMDEPLRRLLGLAAAVHATEISLGQLRAGAAGLEPSVPLPVLFDALDRALRMHILEERSGGYAFRHPVVRAALYDDLPRHRRDELRAALTADPPDPAGDSGWLRTAGRRCTKSQHLVQIAYAISSTAADTGVLLEDPANLVGRAGGHRLSSRD